MGIFILFTLLMIYLTYFQNEIVYSICILYLEFLKTYQNKLPQNSAEHIIHLATIAKYNH